MSSTSNQDPNDTSAPTDDYSPFDYLKVYPKPKVEPCHTCGQDVVVKQEYPETVTVRYCPREVRERATRRRINKLLKDM